MRFVPHYRVCYNLEFHEAFEEFDIDSADADEMSRHGEIVKESTPIVRKADGPIEEKPKKSKNNKEGNK